MVWLHKSSKSSHKLSLVRYQCTIMVSVAWHKTSSSCNTQTHVYNYYSQIHFLGPCRRSSAILAVQECTALLGEALQTHVHLILSRLPVWQHLLVRSHSHEAARIHPSPRWGLSWRRISSPNFNGERTIYLQRLHWWFHAERVLQMPFGQGHRANSNIIKRINRERRA